MENIEDLIERGYSVSMLAKHFRIPTSTMKSRLISLKLKTLNLPNNKKEVPNFCKVCGKECKRRHTCPTCVTKIRRHRNKLRAIDYLGGCCNRCGYANPVALQFHHLRDKDFEIGRFSNKSWDSLLPEIEKCELLCANCHILEHSSREDEKFLSAVNNYKIIAS